MLATTLSLVIIFLPIAFMSGYARRYVNQFGWTMAFSILVSMLVSFTLTPMLSSRLLQARRPRAAAQHGTKEWPFFAWIDRHYGAHARAGRSTTARPVMLGALGDVPARLPAERPGRPRLDPARRPGRAERAPEPARGHLARRHRRASPPSSRTKIAKLKGVEFVNPYVHEGAS